MAELTPSENEWMIMEVIWESKEPMTATKVIASLKDATHVSQKTIRVMINRLVAKGILGYHVDAHDARVYNYYPIRTKEECLQIKSERFVKHFFKGDTSLAVANFLHSSKMTDDQLRQLEDLVRQLDTNSHEAAE